MRVIDYPLMPRPRRFDIDNVPVELVHAPGLDDFGSVLATADAVAIDTETHDAITIDNLWYACRVISVATRHMTPDGAVHRCFVLDVRDLPVDGVARALAAANGPVHGWNVDFDEKVLELYGAPVTDWRDGKLDESIMWAGFPGRGWWLSLSEAARRYLDYEVEGKGSTQTSYDADGDLSQDQIDYAGRDALVTLLLSEVFADMIDAADLRVAADLEQGQRPFLAHMMRHGIPFDREAWLERLETRREALTDTLVEIAKIVNPDPSKTVVGAEVPEGSKTIVAIFDDNSTAQLFNPDSDPQLRDAFNRQEAAVVERQFGRLLEPTDKVDAATLKELELHGSTLAAAVLAYRKVSKEVTTYGENFLKYWSDGRIRSRYKQTQTATGRLAADRPNPQNLPGVTKRYTRPGKGRRMIAADYSQAELRGLAAMADEPAMLEPFRAGLDLHDETARQVFDVELSVLKQTDPDAAKKMRTKVKGVNFGIPYGMQARALARRLIGDGVLDGSTPEAEARAVTEAGDIISKVMDARPQMAAWLKDRDAFVRRLAENPGPVDWDASFKLLECFQAYDGPRRQFKRANKRLPTARELAEFVAPAPTLFDDGWDEETLVQVAADIDWAFRYDAPVVLRPPVVVDGRSIYEPLAFESRTVSGRRRVFAVVMDSGWQRNEDDSGHGGKKNDMFSGLCTSAMLVAATSNKPRPAALRETWSAENGIKLPVGTDRCPKLPDERQGSYRSRRRKFELEERTRCVKAFDGDRRPKKVEFVKYICNEMGPDGKEFLLSRALADAIGQLGPAARNHPIQGAVADIMASAFAKLITLCDEYPTLVWVQSVHDSIQAECDEADAVEIAIRMRILMEEAMVEFFPTVPAKVDAEVSTTLDEDDVEVAVTSEMVDEFRERLASAA